jgi:hypothetical protein
VTVLEVPDDSNLQARISTNSPSGSITLEDVRHIGNYKDIVSEMTLNYELRTHGKIDISTHDGIHELRVEFDFYFRCWLTGSMKRCADVDHASRGLESVYKPLDHRVENRIASNASEGNVKDWNDTSLSANVATSLRTREDDLGQTSRADIPLASGMRLPSSGIISSYCDRAETLDSKAEQKEVITNSLRLSTASKHALRMLDRTKDDLVEIERRVKDIMAFLVDANSSEACQLKRELSQIEAQAKQLETIGIDDVYTGDLRSGKQQARDVKKDMLARFESLFANLETCFEMIQAKRSWCQHIA